MLWNYNITMFLTFLIVFLYFIIEYQLPWWFTYENETQ